MTDPFLRQLDWLVATAGGKEALAKACGRRVGVRTLDSWTRGDYPRTAVSGAVRDLDAWAVAQDFGYPEAAGAPRLVVTCGPRARTSSPDPAPPPPSPSPSPRRRRWPRWVLLAAAQLAVVGVTAWVTVLVTGGGDPPRPATPGDVIAGFLPSQGDGTVHPQTVAGAAVNTYSDPRGLTVGGGGIPAGTAVGVRCRVAASPVPDERLRGWWYLVETGPWAGLWAPAGGFAPGAEPGQEDGHPTDLAVPVCTSATSWSPGS